MDDLRVGMLVRAVRQRLGWRQSDVAARAGVSQKVVSLTEAGQLERISLRTLRAVARVLEISLPFAASWRGGNAARLLDERHAALVEFAVWWLRRRGWEVVVEYTFNHYGERGSIDVLAWHAARRALLVVEVKSRLYDLQDLLAGLQRKVRLAPTLVAAERGWQPSLIGCAVLAPGTTANRSVVTRHDATFGAALPARGRELRRWLHEPAGPMAAVWFVSPSTGVTGKRDQRGARRVRSPHVRSAQRSGERPALP
jgi:transcriptional regulator with XRE-family HTH domain